MDRYYKASASSETGKKVLAIFDRKKKFSEKHDWFCKKYHVRVSIFSKYYLCDMQSVEFEGNSMPNGNIWKRSNDGGFTIRAKARDKSSKDLFDEIKKDWDSVRALKIERREIDRVLGSNDPFFQCGVDVSNKNWVCFFTNRPELYSIPDDCTEISNLEYDTIIKERI